MNICLVSQMNVVTNGFKEKSQFRQTNRAI